MGYAELCQRAVDMVKWRADARAARNGSELQEMSHGELIDLLVNDVLTRDEAEAMLNHLLSAGTLDRWNDRLSIGEGFVPTEPPPPPLVATGRPMRHEVRFYLPRPVWARWSAAAQAMEFPLATWIRLKVDGMVVDKPATAEQSANGRVSANSLGKRLRGLTRGKPFKKTQVVAMAGQLGVTTRALYSALGSLRAFKRLERSGDEYRWVDETK